MHCDICVYLVNEDAKNKKKSQWLCRELWSYPWQSWEFLNTQISSFAESMTIALGEERGFAEGMVIALGKDFF